VVRKYFYRRTGYETEHLINRLSDPELLQHMGVPDQVAARATMVKRLPSLAETWLENLPYIFRPAMELVLENPDMAGTGLILHGPTGTRKTTTAAAILLKTIRKLIPNTDPTRKNFTWHGAAMGLFVDWQDASETFRKGSGESEDAAFESLLLVQRMRPGGDDMTKRGDFLVVDDISRERSTQFNSNELHRILRQRHRDLFPTILTTNHAPKEWVDVYGDPMAGFMSRAFIPIEFSK